MRFDEGLRAHGRLVPRQRRVVGADPLRRLPGVLRAPVRPRAGLISADAAASSRPSRRASSAQPVTASVRRGGRRRRRAGGCRAPSRERSREDPCGPARSVAPRLGAEAVELPAATLAHERQRVRALVEPARGDASRRRVAADGDGALRRRGRVRDVLERVVERRRAALGRRLVIVSTSCARRSRPQTLSCVAAWMSLWRWSMVVATVLLGAGEVARPSRWCCDGAAPDAQGGGDDEGAGGGAGTSSGHEGIRATPLVGWGHGAQPPAGRARAVPRGRHAPPLEVRLTVQRRRLLEAAAARVRAVGLRRRQRRGDRARGRHVQGDVLRALRQQGGRDPRALRRGGDRGRAARWRARRPTRDAPRRYEERVRRRLRAFLDDARRLAGRGADPARARSSARARARGSGATRSSRPSPTSLVPRQRRRGARVRRAELRRRPTTPSRSSARSSRSPRASCARAGPRTSATLEPAHRARLLRDPRRRAAAA